MKLLALTIIGTLVFLGVCADSTFKTQTHPDFFAIRIPGGILETHGFQRTETFHKETSAFFGTTSSEIKLQATYRYAIELRNKWKLNIDDTRHIAYVTAPPFHPVLPVAIDTSTISTWSHSGFLRFDKHQHLQALQKEISPRLESLAQSKEYIELGRKEARISVEEFVNTWILKHCGWSKDCQPCVKVNFEDE